MIAIDDVIINDAVIEDQFVCDLDKCKGACCEDGDAGAPLNDDELHIITEVAEKIRPYLSEEGLSEIEKNGLYRYDRTFGWVTPTINGELCVYGKRNEKGIIGCAFEAAYNDDMISWKKPISCHLFPVRITKSKNDEQDYVNYERRESLCNPACALGKKLKVPVYKFLKEALIRKYGQKFYEALEQIANNYFEVTEIKK